MRIGLVVDASCDLPDSYLEAHGVRILPAIVQADGKTWVDDRDPAQTLMLFRNFIADRGREANSSACGAEVIGEIFLQELVLEFDRVLVISAGAEFSNMFARATEASYAILQNYREHRGEVTAPGGFALRILDSGSVCAGEAVLVARALQLLAGEGAGFEAMRRTLRSETAHVRCLLVPGDPWYLRRRGLDGKGHGIGRAAYAAARIAGFIPVIELAGGGCRTIARPRGFRGACEAALTHAREAIGRNPEGPALVLSFGGDPRLIREMPAYQALELAAADARMELHFSVMSAAMGARLGPGALSVAWLNGTASE
jgi:fatty acid-binding protein DegV